VVVAVRESYATHPGGMILPVQQFEHTDQMYLKTDVLCESLAIVFDLDTPVFALDQLDQVLYPIV
jgi:hypothetical protein